MERSTIEAATREEFLAKVREATGADEKMFVVPGVGTVASPCSVHIQADGRYVRRYDQSLPTLRERAEEAIAEMAEEIYEHRGRDNRHALTVGSDGSLYWRERLTSYEQSEQEHFCLRRDHWAIGTVGCGSHVEDTQPEWIDADLDASGVADILSLHLDLIAEVPVGFFADEVPSAAWLAMPTVHI